MTPNSGAVTREGKPGGSTGRTWTLTLPTGRPLTLNDRQHWAPRARQVRQLRADVAVLARAARIPACQRIAVELHYAPPDRRRRDADNLVATSKVCVDGLVKPAGIVPDDTPEYVESLMPVLDPPSRPARLWLIVQDIGDAA